MTTPSYRKSAVDAHVHVSPEKAEVMAAIMDANHLSFCVNLGILEMLGIPFQEGMRKFQAVFGRRMVYFTTPDFTDTSRGFGERFASELERKVDQGAGGLKIFKELGLRHKDEQGKLIPVNDERLDPLWEKAGALGVPVLIHTADPVAFFQPLDEKNESHAVLELHPEWHFWGPEFPAHDTLLEQRNQVIERHPDTVFIGAHLGNYPENLAYVDACLYRYPNFYVDTSARIGAFGRHPAEELRSFFLKHQDRILFGSDLILGWDAFVETRGLEKKRASRAFYKAHWRFFETNKRRLGSPDSPGTKGRKIEALDLPHEVLQKLYGENARSIIPLLG
jgi:predicted TIM-barrel fold metal-dependent hydrolase